MKLELTEETLLTETPTTSEVNDAVKQLSDSLPNYDVKVVSGGIGIYPKTGWVAEITTFNDNGNLGFSGVTDANYNKYSADSIEKVFAILNNSKLLNLKSDLDVNGMKQSDGQSQEGQESEESLHLNEYSIIQKAKDAAAGIKNKIATAAGNVKNAAKKHFAQKDLIDYLKRNLPNYDVKTTESGIGIYPKTGYVSKVILESVELSESVKIQMPSGETIEANDLNAVVNQITGKDGSASMNDMDKSSREAADMQRVGKEVQDLIADSQWQKAFDKANAAEKQTVINEFMTKWEEANKIPELNEAESLILSKWISELGFRQANNPFLDYMKQAKLRGAEFDQYKLIIINNLYANRKISQSDLRGTGKSGINHIIFNESWIKSTDEPEFMAETYSWLSIDNNVNTLPIDDIAKEAKAGNFDFPKSYRSLSSSMPADKVRDIIIFKEDNSLNSSYVVNNLLRYKEEDDARSKDDIDIISDMVASFKKMDSKTQNTFIDMLNAARRNEG